MYNYNPSKRDFYEWLNTRTLIGPQKVYRKDWISSFHGSITLWMASLGYKMNETWKHSPLALAKWLYCIQIIEVAQQDYMRTMYYEEPNHRDTLEDRDRYEFILDYMAVEKFLENYEQNEELCQRGKAGMRVYAELPDLLYRYIDLENSKQGHYISRILETNNSDSEDDDGGNRNTDSYLADSADGWH
jgi:hypothetical protein